MKPRALLLTLLTLAFLLPLVPFTPSALADTGFFDDFETDSLGVEPEGEFYVFTPTGTGTYLTTNTRALGTKSVLFQPATAAATTAFVADSFGLSLCGPAGDARSAAWAFNIDALPGAGATVNMQVSAGTGANFLVGIIRVDELGAVTLESQTSTNTVGPTVIPSITIAPDTWYNASMAFNCPQTRISASVGTGLLTSDPSGSAETGTGATNGLRIGSTTTAHPALWIDNYGIQTNDLPPTAVGSSATVAVTDLTGFDVDPSGTNLIARTNDGEFVRTYSPYSDDATLDLLASADTCETTINDGVVASQFGTPDSVVGYLTCEAGTNDPDFFRIRNALLEQPSINCANDCDFDIALENDVLLCTGEFEDRSDLRNLKQVEELPLDYSNEIDDPLGEGPHLAVGYAYTTTAGRLGVAKYVTQDGCNGYGTARTQFSTSEPEDFCFWRYDDRNFMAAVDALSPTKLYEYTSSGAGTITLVDTFSSLNGGVGLSCAGDKMLVQQGGDRISLIDIDNGSVVWSKTVENAPPRSVLLDPTGEWVFWVDDPSAGSPYAVSVGWAGNGTAFGSFVTPTSAWEGMRTDEGAQNLWVAQESAITWYEPAKNLDEIIEGCVGICGPGDAIGDDDEAGDSITFIGAPIDVPEGTTAWGWRLVMAALLTFGIAAAGYFSFGKRPIGGYLGAGAGFLTSWGTGLFDTVVVTAIIILLLVAIYGERRMSTSG